MKQVIDTRVVAEGRSSYFVRIISRQNFTKKLVVSLEGQLANHSKSVVAEQSRAAKQFEGKSANTI